MRDIVVVHSTRIRAELTTRGPSGDWPANPEIIEAGGALRLDSIAALLPIIEIYASTHIN